MTEREGARAVIGALKILQPIEEDFAPIPDRATSDKHPTRPAW